mmetsp:Transcript_3924/g.4252  ORF Transcript_3924/g.4252 Transcript_3924/m.4252 type:complete len:99 (-) Transcript_3924:383-679(-)
MGIPGVAADFATVLLVGIGLYIYHSWKESSNDEHPSESSGFIHYGNPNNNHDHKKVRHKSRKDAEREASRMQHNFPHDTFHAYKNCELDSWFVGRSSY